MKTLKIMPCPVHAGKHPYHDARWIATEDAEVEFSSHVPNDWALKTGSLICQMRDCENQKEYARLIAAAPELLASLIEMCGALEDSNPGAYQTLADARAAIRKATQP